MKRRIFLEKAGDPSGTGGGDPSVTAAKSAGGSGEPKGGSGAGEGEETPEELRARLEEERAARQEEERKNAQLLAEKKNTEAARKAAEEAIRAAKENETAAQREERELQERRAEIARIREAAATGDTVAIGLLRKMQDDYHERQERARRDAEREELDKLHDIEDPEVRSRARAIVKKGYSAEDAQLMVLGQMAQEGKVPTKKGARIPEVTEPDKEPGEKVISSTVKGITASEHAATKLASDKISAQVKEALDKGDYEAAQKIRRGLMDQTIVRS